MGVHEFGITCLVGNATSPCGDRRARVHHTSYIRVNIVPKDCVCPIYNYGCRDTDLNPGRCGASPALCGLTSGADRNVIADNDCIMQIIVIVDLFGVVVYN